MKKIKPKQVGTHTVYASKDVIYAKQQKTTPEGFGRHEMGKVKYDPKKLEKALKNTKGIFPTGIAGYEWEELSLEQKVEILREKIIVVEDVSLKKLRRILNK